MELEITMAMVHCPRCDQGTDQLHTCPPAVITQELIGSINGDYAVPDIALCSACIEQLMNGNSPSAPTTTR
jgi:hypothetical protein